MRPTRDFGPETGRLLLQPNAFGSIPLWIMETVGKPRQINVDSADGCASLRSYPTVRIAGVSGLSEARSPCDFWIANANTEFHNRADTTGFQSSHLSSRDPALLALPGLRRMLVAICDRFPAPRFRDFIEGDFRKDEPVQTQLLHDLPGRRHQVRPEGRVSQICKIPGGNSARRDKRRHGRRVGYGERTYSRGKFRTVALQQHMKVPIHGADIDLILQQCINDSDRRLVRADAAGKQRFSGFQEMGQQHPSWRVIAGMGMFNSPSETTIEKILKSGRRFVATDDHVGPVQCLSPAIFMVENRDSDQFRSRVRSPVGPAAHLHQSHIGALP